ncbi:MAG: penicillin-binding protein 2 [Bacteroidetes bacterium]|nr:penicillin-binding protein 2 [Bacteroidota bacterium]
MNPKSDILWRIYFSFGLVMIFGMAILGKAAKTQFVEGDYWIKMAEKLTIKDLEIEAERGNIYDIKGRMLATTIPTFELRMDLKSEALTDERWEENIDSICLLFEAHLGEQSRNQWRQDLDRGRKTGERYFLIKRKVSFPELQMVQSWPLFRQGRFKSGLQVIQHNNRRMPFGMLAQRTIGYIRDSGKIKVGIEGRFDKELAGVRGLKKVQKIANGVYMPMDEDNDLGAKPGLDVYTTIDVNLQDVAENSLMRSLKTYRADHGCAILMNIKTGEIKAIANLGKNSDSGYVENFNYAIGELNEPGSVFKLASMIAILDNNYADENTKVDLENGQTRFYNRTMEDAHAHPGLHSLKEIFEVSSNVGISKLVNKHFKEDKGKFYKMLESLHLTQTTGIDLEGEPKPDIAPTKSWSGVSLPWISIGYEVRLTPLQILNLYAAVANNGVQMKPYLIREVRENDQVIKQFKPEILERRICSEQTVVKLRAMLEGVVDSGTASDIRSLDYKIAGKTGTNLISGGSRKYSDKIYQATFVGYFPSNDPIYACIVVVNNPDTKVGYYGGKVAAPVFRDIADRIYSTEIAIHHSMDKKLSAKSERAVMKGNRADLSLIYKQLNLNNTQKDIASEWVESMWRDSSVKQQSLYRERGKCLLSPK